MPKSIGIVGGGFLGMTLALRLAERGFRVTLFEADGQLGGLASYAQIGNYTWDRFYHVILLSDSNVLKLLDQLKLKDRIIWNQTRTGFLTDGKLYSLSSALEFLTFPPLNLLDKLRLGASIFYASRIKNWERLEEIKVGDWLNRLSGRRTFQKIWLPLLKSKLGEDYRNTNAAFIWATIARMYAARRSGLKQEKFGYVAGGYLTVTQDFEKLLREKGVEIQTGLKVYRVEKTGAGLAVETGAGERKEFQAAALTIPCGPAARLCPQLSLSEKERLAGVRYLGVLCAALVLKKPLAGYYITNITEEGLPFTAVIEMTALVDRKNFNGRTLLYLPRYLAEDDPFWTRDDGDIQEEFLSALEKAYPAFHREEVEFFGIQRARQVAPLTTLNYSRDLLPPMKTSVDRLYLVNSAQIPNGTMNINEIIGLAERRAAEISADLR